jgi:hypothetical protein
MPKTRAPKAATVLSVSKDKELLFLRGEILKSEGFHVINALSVEEAIGALSDSIDLLLVGNIRLLWRKQWPSPNRPRISATAGSVCA